MRLTERLGENAFGDVEFDTTWAFYLKLRTNQKEDPDEIEVCIKRIIFEPGPGRV
jgi:hypothetical protein